jgi:hypothetical protein
MTEELPDFSNKSVAFYVKTTPGMPAWIGDGIVLQSPIFRLQGTRLFVVGRTPEARGDVSDWSANRDASLAWDSVVYYVIIPTDEYVSMSSAETNHSEEELPVRKPSDRKWLVEISIVLMGLVIPVALLIGLVIWILKMLVKW